MTPEPLAVKLPVREKGAAGDGFAAGDEGIGTVQAGGTIFAGRRRRRDSGTAATAGRNPKGSRCDERCKQAVHRTPRRASLCAGVKVEAGLSGKPLALRTATASAPFCTTRAAK